MIPNNTYYETDEITRKLDAILSELEVQSRRQKELQMLQADLALISKDIFRTAVDELEVLRPHFDSGDVRDLVQKLLRNIRNINRMLDGLEQFSNFLDDAAPLRKEMFQETVSRLNEMDRKGYFEFGKELLQIIDTVVTSFSIEDVRMLRENVISILHTVRSLTQPEMLTTMNNAVGFYKSMGSPVEEEVTYRDLFRALKDPEVKRGLAFMLQFVQNMASTNSNDEKTTSSVNTNGNKEILK